MFHSGRLTIGEIRDFHLNQLIQLLKNMLFGKIISIPIFVGFPEFCTWGWACWSLHPCEVCSLHLILQFFILGTEKVLLVTFHSNVEVFYSMVAHVRLIVSYMYVEEFLRNLMFIPLYCNLWLQYR